MVKVPNLRIEISEDARRALNFEVALTGESLSTCASAAILHGVSDRAMELAGLNGKLCGIRIDQTTCQPNTPKTVAKAPDTVSHAPTVNNNTAIKNDPRAVRYIMDNMGELSGVQIAAALNRSVSSVNKYIKSIRDDKLIVRG